MRWSPLVSLFTVLAITSFFEGVFAAPLDVILENRGVPKTKSRKSRPNHGRIPEKSSPTYRGAALKEGNTYTKSGLKITKTKTPKAPRKGKDAGRRDNQPSLSHTDDHIFRPYP